MLLAFVNNIRFQYRGIGPRDLLPSSNSPGHSRRQMFRPLVLNPTMETICYFGEERYCYAKSVCPVCKKGERFYEKTQSRTIACPNCLVLFAVETLPVNTIWDKRPYRVYVDGSTIRPETWYSPLLEEIKAWALDSYQGIFEDFDQSDSIYYGQIYNSEDTIVELQDNYRFPGEVHCDYRRIIRHLAHKLWEERGCPEGTPDIDWHAAVNIFAKRYPELMN